MTAPAEGGPAIRCRGVRKAFGAVHALDGLDLDVQPGRVVGYLGPNGSGKTTTIRILLDLARADSGEVRVLGADPRRAGPALRSRIGYLPGEIRLDERLGVAAMLRSWSELRGGTVDPAYRDELCERFGLDPGRPTRGLSTGNRRKVGLVGAFMARPDLLVLDEPTSGIDPLVQEEILALLAETTARGATVFLSSHVLAEVQRAAHDVIVLRAGKVVAAGPVDELRRAARQRFAVRFAGPAAGAAFDELARLTSVSGITRRGNEVDAVLTGPPGELLAVLSRHDVEHFVLPEPELEDVFLRLYGGPDERTEATAGGR